MNYNLATLVANFVGRGLQGKKLPSFYETFPALADEDAIEQTEKRKEYNDAMRYKIQFMEMASNHNKKFRSKGGASS